MARRKKNFSEDLIETSSKLPWWACVVFALAAYLWLHGMTAGGAATVALPGTMREFADPALFESVVLFGQYAIPAGFLLLAALSAYGRFRHKGSQDPAMTSADLDALKRMSWQQFKFLVSEAFRRKGYSVSDKSRGGVNAVFDLILKKKEEIFLVQCKQWRAIKVGVKTVSELHGLMEDKGAAGGFVVTFGAFTDDAQAFARDKNINLIAGNALGALISGVSVPSRIFRDPLSVLTTGAPFCPECQGRMRKRKIHKGPHAGKTFWTCMRYPDCKGTRPS